MDIRTSFMQKLPWVTKHHQPYLPLYPYAMESLDLRGYDLVLSSSSAFSQRCDYRDRDVAHLLLPYADALVLEL